MAGLLSLGSGVVLSIVVSMQSHVFVFFRGIRSICQSAATGFSKTKPIGRPYERVAARGARGIGGSFEAEMPRLIIFRKFSEDNVY